jgi:hypothetical protein
VIQYSRTFPLIINALEYWVARSSRAMTAEYGAPHYFGHPAMNFDRDIRD